MSRSQRKDKTMKKLSTKLFATTALTLSLSTAAHAVECGDTVGPNEKIVLTQDLLCPSYVDVALTIVGPATLDMNGKSIICLAGLFSDNITNQGVSVSGKRARIKNGTISSCQHGMLLQGEGRHRFDNVHASDTKASGFQVGSDNNTLRRNTVSSAGDHGFYVLGDKNKLQDNFAELSRLEGFRLVRAYKNTLTRNRSYYNSGSGFWTSLGGDENKFIKNTSAFNEDEGFKLSDGRKHLLVNNTAQENNWNGIFVDEEVSATRVTRNTLRGNGAYDIYQAAPGCGANKWSRNTFGSSNIGCVE